MGSGNHSVLLTWNKGSFFFFVSILKRDKSCHICNWHKGHQEPTFLLNPMLKKMIFKHTIFFSIVLHNPFVYDELSLLPSETGDFRKHTNKPKARNMLLVTLWIRKTFPFNETVSTDSQLCLNCLFDNRIRKITCINIFCWGWRFILLRIQRERLTLDTFVYTYLRWAFK